MIPILAGYIAFSIADKPGLVPGMIGGYIAASGSFTTVRAAQDFLEESLRDFWRDMRRLESKM